LIRAAHAVTAFRPKFWRQATNCQPTSWNIFRGHLHRLWFYIFQIQVIIKGSV